MQSLSLALKNLRGIRTGLGLEVPTLDFERPADGSELVAIAAANGSGVVHSGWTTSAALARAVKAGCLDFCRRLHREPGELGSGQQAFEIGVEADHMLALVDGRGGQPGVWHVIGSERLVEA